MTTQTPSLPLIVSMPAGIAETFKAACIDRIPQKTRKGTASWQGPFIADGTAQFLFAVVADRRHAVAAATQAMANVFDLSETPAEKPPETPPACVLSLNPGRRGRHA